MSTQSYQGFRQRYGPIAVVTGASSGIGEQFAHQLASRGLDLLLVARRQERLEALSELLSAEHGVDARVLRADLGTEEGVAALCDATEDSDVGLLVNNAGFGIKGEFLDIAVPRHEAMIRLNCISMLALTHTFGHRFAARGRGGIVITSSTAAFQGTPLTAAYAASKGFGLMLAEALHDELRPRGVDVLALCPGPTDTEGPRNTGVTPDDMPVEPMSASAVVAAGLGALGERAHIVPGKLNTVLAFTTRLVPRALAVRLAGKAIREVSAKAKERLER